MSLFITFEGIEGCGKTTQSSMLSSSLNSKEIETVSTREPGGCRISDIIRSILLDSSNSEITPLTELLLYAAARAQHVEEIIKPALVSGKTVLCDRFTDATTVYQGFARGVDLKLIGELNKIAAPGIKPDLTILLDCPVETGISRALSRMEFSTGPDEARFEREATAFHTKVRNGYLKLAKDNPGRFFVADAARTKEELHIAISEKVMNLLDKGITRENA